MSFKFLFLKMNPNQQAGQNYQVKNFYFITFLSQQIGESGPILKQIKVPQPRQQ